MQNDKLKTITNLFEGKEIRSLWDSEIEDYYFSVVDVISVLTDANIPRNYWSDLKRKLKSEGSELHENIVQLKLKASDGKYRNTDVLDTEGIFRLIESVPSKNAEPFKLWLAKLGRQEVDNVFDPSKGIDKMIDYYLKKGYSLEWIEARIKAIINRKKLTHTWKENGIESNNEYAILTNEIYKSWSGMKASEYKKFKGIRKESLRDNMTDIEVVLTDLGELATRELAKKHKPTGLEENKKIAKVGGNVAKVARDDLEEKLGESIISSQNILNYQYVDNSKQIENK
ncbi:MAG: Bro-N domain-containing protein [Bacilli bacterium]|nr:Bro-N domain-containing protein [Bacilli bacterium]